MSFADLRWHIHQFVRLLEKKIINKKNNHVGNYCEKNHSFY